MIANTCTNDMHDRRFEKKVTEDNTVTSWQRFVYRGYLQIAAFDVNSVIIDEEEHQGHTLAITTFWDPTEPTATRPLAITDHTGNTSTTYFHTHDLTKNVCELLDVSGEIITSYDYTLFGAVTASNTTTPNPFMFSSEILDPETSLVYYNFRHYNPTDGRWIFRDPIDESGGWNLYSMIYNSLINIVDTLGLSWEIKRDNNSSKALATSESPYGDTKESLAAAIGLNVEEFDEWADVVASRKTGTVAQSPTLICSAYIPNTVVAYWAGDMGGLGRTWVYKDWYSHLSSFEKLGYKIIKTHFSSKSSPTYEYQLQLEKESNAATLYGTIFWGHGNKYSTDAEIGVKPFATYRCTMVYSHLALRYAPAFAYIYACESNSGKDAFNNPLDWIGFDGLLVPLGIFNLDI